MKRNKSVKKNIVSWRVFLAQAVFLVSLGLLLSYAASQTIGVQKKQLSNTDSTFSADIVADANRAAGMCSNFAQREQCYADRLREVTEVKGHRYAADVLLALQELDITTRGCHLMAHSISIAATKKNPENWKNLLTEVPVELCTGGFLHGIIEMHSVYDTSFQINAESLSGVCTLIQDKIIGRDQDCAHIMGHLFLVETIGNIPKSIAMCEEIDVKWQYECFSGVFMENMTRDNLISHKIAPRLPWNAEVTQEQQEICKKYSGVASTACWREIAHMFVYVQKDYPPAFRGMCNIAPTEDARRDCYLHAVGIAAVSSNFDVKNLKLLCRVEDSVAVDTCADWATGSLIASTPKFSDRAILLCNSLPEENQSLCFTKVGEKLARLVPPSEITKYCITAPEKFKKNCSRSSI